MLSRLPARITFVMAVVVTIMSLVGVVVAIVLNVFFLDDYDAYGEVPIPGSASVHLPKGEVTVSLHTVVIGSPNGGLPVPPLGVTISPPDGVAQPSMAENIGSTTIVNNDAHVRVWVAQIPADGTYNITTDGQVNGYIQPRLAFGHVSSYGFLIWLFVGTFGVGLVASIVAGRWLRSTRRKASAAFVAGSYQPPPTTAYEPGADGVRLERLKTLAALRDSGALTEEEFQTEKRRILEGH
jgi:hypothetical protein